MTEKKKEKKDFAFSRALAGESENSKELNAKYDKDNEVYNGVTFDDMYAYARTIAYKVAHNIALGRTMDPDEDPLTYVNCEEE